MKPMMYKLSVLLILLALNPGDAVAQNDRWFHTQAQVIDIQPVFETIDASSSKAHCQRPVRAIAGSMSEDIRLQERKQMRRFACETSAKRSRRKITGYWVTYEYQGHEGRRYMWEKPGSWIPVTVNLQPLQVGRNGSAYRP